MAGNSFRITGLSGKSPLAVFNRQAQAFQIEPDKVGAFEWINQNINKDSVILTSSLKDNLYLAIFTHANVFIPRSQHSLAPDIEALERFLLLYKAPVFRPNA